MQSKQCMIDICIFFNNNKIIKEKKGGKDQKGKGKRILQKDGKVSFSLTITFLTKMINCIHVAFHYF